MYVQLRQQDVAMHEASPQLYLALFIILPSQTLWLKTSLPRAASRPHDHRTELWWPASPATLIETLCRLDAAALKGNTE